MRKVIEDKNIIYIDEIWKQIEDSKYEVSNYGRFRKFYIHKYRYLKTFRKGSQQIIKLHINGKGKDYNVAKLVIESFKRKIKKNEVAYHKNGIISDNRLSNLEILTRSEAGRKTGWQSRRQAVVMLDKDGTIEKVFNGTRDAASQLFISRQTVSDYCNKKVEKPMYKLYWANELIKEE